MRAAQLVQLPDASEELALHGIGVPAPLGGGPVHGPPVDVAAVLRLQRIVVIAVVVFSADFIPAVKDGNAAEGEHVGVEHQVTPQRPGDLLLVPLVSGGLQTAERGGGAAETGVAGLGVVVVKLAAGGAAAPFSGEILVQEALVRHLFHAVAGKEGIIQAPADVVVAAQII